MASSVILTIKNKLDVNGLINEFFRDYSTLATITADDIRYSLLEINNIFLANGRKIDEVNISHKDIHNIVYTVAHRTMDLVRDVYTELDLEISVESVYRLSLIPPGLFNIVVNGFTYGSVALVDADVGQKQFKIAATDVNTFRGKITWVLELVTDLTPAVV